MSKTGPYAGVSKSSFYDIYNHFPKRSDMSVSLYWKEKDEIIEIGICFLDQDYDVDEKVIANLNSSEEKINSIKKL